VADGFLGRWAKRKNDALQGKPLDEPVPSRPAAAPSAPLATSATGATGVNAAAVSPASKVDVVAGASEQKPVAAEQAPLTLEDTHSLTKDSDFKPFMNKAVEPGVRNAAMKKLFADPHFNVMDRMDIYIDDYSQADPIPAAMLRQMTSAKFLKLFDDEEEDKKDGQKDGQKDGHRDGQKDEEGQSAEGGNGAEGNGDDLLAEVQTVPSLEEAASNPPNSDNPQPLGTSAEADSHQDNHAHSDLRLQPDHAAESPDPGRGAA
jgi:hypothetical protein